MEVLTRARGLLECWWVTRRVQAYLDGELDPAEASRLAAHLQVCDHCGMEAATYQALREALATMRHDVDPATVDRLQRFVTRLGSELRDAEEGPAGDAS